MLFEMLLSLEKQYSKKLAKLHFVKNMYFIKEITCKKWGNMI